MLQTNKRKQKTLYNFKLTTFLFIKFEQLNHQALKNLICKQENTWGQQQNHLLDTVRKL